MTGARAAAVRRAAHRTRGGPPPDLAQEESYAQKLAAEKLSEEKDKPLLPWARAGGGAAEGGEGTSPKSWEQHPLAQRAVRPA